MNLRLSMSSKGVYRLYKYDRMGGLVKLYRGNKGHHHPNQHEAREQAIIYLNKRAKYVQAHIQVLIMRYNANWNSEIVEILSKDKDDEIRRVKV